MQYEALGAESRALRCSLYNLKAHKCSFKGLGVYFHVPLGFASSERK
jgi:hypothetical protein